MLARERVLSTQNAPGEATPRTFRAFNPDNESPIEQVGCIPFRPCMRSSKNPLREKSNLLNRFNLIWVVQFSRQK
jgi:hypothetical protein